MDNVKNIGVLLVEDHPLVREGIRSVLNKTSDIRVVGESDTGEEALVLLKSLEPQIMICDVRLPGMNGIEALSRSKQASPNTRSIVLSAYDEEEYIREAIAQGAYGYILKTVDLDELPDIIRRVNSGQVVIYPPVFDKLSRLMGATEYPSDMSGSLSLRESEIIKLAARGLNNKTIARRLGLSVRTVEGHFSRIFDKLSVTSRMEAVAKIRAKGLADLDGD